MQKEGWKYVGADESNNGRFPATYVAVFSNFDSDIIDHSPNSNSKSLLSKIRSHDVKVLTRRLARRDYSFLLLTEEEYEMTEHYRLWGNILGSLLLGEHLGEILEIYIDGEITRKAKDHCKGCIHEATRLEYPRIRLFNGGNYDRKFDIVNLADEQAHFLFRKKTLEELTVNPHKKQLVFS